MRRQTFSMGIDPIARSIPEQVDLADGSAAWVVDTGPDEGIPVLDMVKVKRALSGSRSRLVGPNCPGVIFHSGPVSGSAL